MLFGVIAALFIVPGVLTLVLTFFRKSQYPEKTLYNCFLNVCLTPLRLFKIGPFKQGKLTLEKAMKHAVKKTGFNDFGDLTFLDAYKAIFDTPTHRQLKLTNIGYIMYQIELN